MGHPAWSCRDGFAEEGPVGPKSDLNEGPTFQAEESHRAQA